MYNVYDFLRGDFGIKIETEQDYKKTIEFLDKYNIKHNRRTNYSEFSFHVIKGSYIKVEEYDLNLSTLINRLKCNHVFNGQLGRICGHRKTAVTIDEINMTNNKIV